MSKMDTMVTQRISAFFLFRATEETDIKDREGEKSEQQRGSYSLCK